MKVSVVIPAVRANVVRTAIDAVRRQTRTDWELIIVGQGTDTSVRAVTDSVTAVDPRVRYVHLDKRGASCARNAGVRAAKNEIIAFTDDDAEADEHWLAAIVERFERYPDIGGVSGSVIPPSKSSYALGTCPILVAPPEYVYDPATHQEPPDDWDWISCNVSFRRSAMELVGPFDELLGPGADFPIAEDTDYKLRLVTAGVKMASTPDATVLHTYGYRTGVRAMAHISQRYAYGNGGLAGKLTLMNDKRGEEWIQAAREQKFFEGWKSPYRLPVNMRRWHYTIAGYRHCIDNYRVVNNLLQHI